jgi:hypothetical protein
MHITASVSSMTMSQGSITITSFGWKNWRRTRRPPPIDTTGPVKTTLTPTSNVRSGPRSGRNHEQTGFRTVGANFYGEFDDADEARAREIIGDSHFDFDELLKS